MQVYDRQCLMKREGCLLAYTGETDGLHFLSKLTAAGDEIGWEFVSLVTNSQISISAFCTLFSSRYYFSDVKFMSRQTFTDWIFSWLSNFKIDFRKTCSSCQFNPKVLACDGTKIGMLFKNVSLQAFETPTTKKMLHRNIRGHPVNFFHIRQKMLLKFESQNDWHKEICCFLLQRTLTALRILWTNQEVSVARQCVKIMY